MFNKFLVRFRLLGKIKLELTGISPQKATVLDLGCGKDSPIRFFKDIIRNSCGVDSFPPYLEKSRNEGIHDEYLHADVLDALRSMDNNSFDVVIALDLIEHLPKDDGKILLRQMERVADKKVIVFTPNGFLPQEIFDGNALQHHLSGWEVNEMLLAGYRIYGMSGLKYLRGAQGLIKYRPYIVFRALSAITQLLCYYIPALAFQILCIKDINKK